VVRATGTILFSRKLRRQEAWPAPTNSSVSSCFNGRRPQVFEFFADARNLAAITPHFLGFSRDHTHADRDADRRAHRVPAVAIWAAAELAHAHHGLATRRARFVDEQESGPFALWRHTHGFEARGHATLVRDTVQYREPLGPLGALAHLLFVERTMNRIFDFRREEIARALNTGASASPVLHVASDAP